MPEIVVSQLIKIVLFMVLMAFLVVLFISFISPKSFEIIGAINIAISNAIASILG